MDHAIHAPTRSATSQRCHQRFSRTGRSAGDGRQIRFHTPHRQNKLLHREIFASIPRTKLPLQFNFSSKKANTSRFSPHFLAFTGRFRQILFQFEAYRQISFIAGRFRQISSSRGFTGRSAGGHRPAGGNAATSDSLSSSREMNESLIRHCLTVIGHLDGSANCGPESSAPNPSVSTRRQALLPAFHQASVMRSYLEKTRAIAPRG